MNSATHARFERLADLYADTIEAESAHRSAVLAGGDPDLWAEVQDLLALGLTGSSFLEAPTWSLPSPPPPGPMAEAGLAPGSRLGPFTIQAPIGRGGMGMVYRATQDHPKRVVAVKLHSTTLASPLAARRFGLEAQTLSRLQHPGIAQVYQAGIMPGPTGPIPYMAMEYVPGVKLTEHCDRQRLTIRERLELFVGVCDAVAHAHTKGVIHRDLSPDNILVVAPGSESSTTGPGHDGAEHTGAGQPKIIDFGIARVADAHAAGGTLYTEPGVLMGKPEYMSPEQAEMTSQDLDTRSDVYALGVILYELITGVLPFDSRELRAKGPMEIRRVLREVEPPRPSTRLTVLSTTHGEEAARIAQARHARLDELPSVLKRELEWIPLKAMKKRREERYRAVQELADDTRNYLAGQALVAAPDSAWYRARKFVRRQRVPIAIASLLLVGLSSALGVSLWSFRVRTHAMDQRAESYLALNKLVSSLVSDLASDKSNSPIQVIDALAAKVRTELDPKKESTGRVHAALASACDALGSRDRQLDEVTAAQACYEIALGREHYNTIGMAAQRAYVLLELRRYAEGRALLDEQIELGRRVLPRGDNEMQKMLLRRSEMTVDPAEFPQAERDLRELLEIEGGDGYIARQSGRAHLTDRLARVVFDLGRQEEGLKIWDEAYAIAAVLPVQEERLCWMNASRNNKGMSLARLGRWVEAEACLRESLSLAKQYKPVDPLTDPEICGRQFNLGYILTEQGKLDEAEPLLREVVGIMESRAAAGEWKPDDVFLALGRTHMGTLLVRRGSHAEAEAYLLNAWAVLDTPDPAKTLDRARKRCRAALAALYRSTNREAQAQAIEHAP